MVSLICIPLILLSPLMRLVSTSAAILYNSLGSWHYWQTHIGIKASDKKPFFFNFRFNIGMCNLKHVNEFVSISEFVQSRKDKINSENITERFVFSLFDSSIMTQIVERMCTVKLLYF